MTGSAGRPYRARVGFAALLSAVALTVGAKAATGSGQPPVALAAPTAMGSTATTPAAGSSGLAAASPTPTPAAGTATADPSATTAAPATPSASASATGTSTTGTSTTRAVTGDAIDTRFGAVQVKVVLTGTKIVDVVTVQVPDRERRDREINDWAVPALRQEVLTAQNAKIDSLSGASYTSYGYAWSVQSALDKAGA